MNTIKSYSKIPGRMPQPDVMIGRINGWLPSTIDDWIVPRVKQHETSSSQLTGALDDTVKKISAGNF